jgi:hypothetical protein
VFFGPTLQALERLNPGHGYYHPHGSHTGMLKLFAQKWASVDHISPVALGGGNELPNLLTVCVDCNIRKSANPTAMFALPIPPEIREQNFDGLALLYLELANHDERWGRAIRSVYSIT